MESASIPRHRIGYWFSEKKSKKFNLEEFHGICDQAGLDLIKVKLENKKSTGWIINDLFDILFQINFNLPLEDQGPFSAIIHKMTDVIAQADLGDPEVF